MPASDNPSREELETREEALEKNPYFKLAGLPKIGDHAQKLSKREVQRRLLLAENSVKRLQRGVRNWMQVTRVQKERYKCTTRSRLQYRSCRPPDKAAELHRRVRVEEHGWRAPLNRMYTPLGKPMIDITRKPTWGEWAVRTDAVSPTLRQNDGERNVFIGHGETVHGTVAKFGFAYYQTLMTDGKAAG
jgi:hypothetical protein